LRLKRDRRGQARVIEAFFAATLLFSCLTIIPSSNNTLNYSYNTKNLESMAQNIILTLNSDGQLARLVDNRDWGSLGDCIEAVLPIMIWFNLTVYDPDGNVLNQHAICNGGAVSNTISSIEYICASPNGRFAIYLLQLQLAVVD
jgi:hypothetical protein